MFGSKKKKVGKLTVFHPTTLFIAKSSSIDITGHFDFNKCWKDVQNYNAGYLSIGENATVEIGDFTVYSGCTIGIAPRAHFKVDNAYINCDSKIRCYKEITIGSGTVISENVIIRDNDDHQILSSNHTPTQPIHIGNHVWVGMGAIILKGVTVGDGSIIAAGSVVINDVPPHTMVAGVPATVKKSNVVWE